MAVARDAAPIYRRALDDGKLTSARPARQMGTTQRGRDTASLQEFPAFKVVVVPKKFGREPRREPTMAAKTAGRNELQPLTSHLRDIVRKRDFYAGGLMALIGLGIALKGATYRAGTLMHMGPGFLPTALGVILVLLGIADRRCCAGAGRRRRRSKYPASKPAMVGLVLHPDEPGVFHYFRALLWDGACDLLLRLHRSAGRQNCDLERYDRSSTVVTVFGVALFSYFLQVPMPVFTWRGSL